MKESAILHQLTLYQEAAMISADFSDLVSVEELADKTKKSIRQVKDILNANGIKNKGQFGKSYLYSKAELLKLIKGET